MDSRPTGTITMVFSDIQGSTVLLRRLGKRYMEALSGQRALLREAFTAWHGREMGTEGDGFFVVFASAGDAVRACLNGQRMLADHQWPDDADVRVRMGVHTGEPQSYEDGYVGMDVHLAARIAATAHGGQVILSEPTLKLVAHSLPRDVSVCELGLHRLKDFPIPERIYQLVAPGLQSDFPKLRSLGTPSNLPAPPTPLVGRTAELADVISRISSGTRMVTLVGPGGTGKTRLALAIADGLDSRFADGVYFVPLAPVTEVAAMWTTIGQVLGMEQTGSIHTVLDYLHDRRILIVLDNLEQIAQASEVVLTLMGAGDGVTVMATSRRPLHLMAEHTYPVPPLALPSVTGSDLLAFQASASIELFVQRATMVCPNFRLTEENVRDVAAICLRLDGLPLAIEIAASRVRFFPPAVLLRRLGNSLGLSSGETDRPRRQQTLRDTIAWSEALLTPARQRVFRRLGVFVDGCDLDAFAEVALGEVVPDEDDDPLEVLENLMDLSLVRPFSPTDGEPRVRMLATVREYAREQLPGADEIDELRRKHAEYYLHLAERVSAQLRGADHLAMLDRLEVEHNNFRAALDWALSPVAHPESPDPARATIGLRLVVALSWFWYGHGHAAVGRRWLERAIEATPDDATTHLSQALHGLGVLLLQQGEFDAGERVLERSLALCREMGDPQRIAQELSSLGVARRDRGDLDGARHLLEESVGLARDLDDPRRLATALSNLGLVEIDSGAADRAISILREASNIDGEIGDAWGFVVDQANLAIAFLRTGLAEQAWDILTSVVDDTRQLADLDLSVCIIEGFAVTCAALGLPLVAATLAGAAEELRESNGLPQADLDAGLLERYLAPARADSNSDDWRRAFEVGRGLGQDDAFAFILAETSRAPERASGLPLETRPTVIGP